MAVSKHDFEKMAEIVEKVQNKEDKDMVCSAFIRWSSEENPRFNKDRFLQACGMEEKK